MKRFELYLEDCSECPEHHAAGFHLQWVCHHLESEPIRREYDYKKFPEWCPLTDMEAE